MNSSGNRKPLDSEKRQLLSNRNSSPMQGLDSNKMMNSFYRVDIMEKIKERNRGRDKQVKKKEMIKESMKLKTCDNSNRWKRPESIKNSENRNARTEKQKKQKEMRNKKIQAFQGEMKQINSLFQRELSMRIRHETQFNWENHFY